MKKLTIRTDTRFGRAVGAGIAVLLGVSLMSAVPYSAAAVEPPALEQIKPVEGELADPLPDSVIPTSTPSTDVAGPAVLPVGDYEVEASADSGTANRSDTSPSEDDWTEVEDSGLSIGEIDLASDEAGTDDDQPVNVVVKVLDESAAGDLGVNDFALQISAPELSSDGVLPVRIPNELLEGRYGSNYASRVQWVTTTDELTSGEFVSVDDVAVSDEYSTMNIAVSSAAVTVAAVGSPVPSNGAGSISATPLSPAGAWGQSLQTGGFSWSVPFRAPPAAAGPMPTVSLEYNSQAVDGETASSNNQPSAIGDGWGLGGTGFIERTYVSCGQDGESTTAAAKGDLCWKNNNATISLGGMSGKLVRKSSATDEWRLEQDDGTRIQRFIGASSPCVNNAKENECWIVTKPDGTKFFFGKHRLPGWASSSNPATQSVWVVPVFGNNADEPCHAATFAASSCTQAWRWNLDYVVDVHGNAQSLYYTRESNKYALNGGTATTYTRGGQLEHIDYGFKDEQAYTVKAPTGRVVLGYATNGRCKVTSDTGCTAAATLPTTPSNYPDVPWDQNCAATTCTNKTPTFWTTAMLSTVTTQVFKPAATVAAGTYATVDVWTLGHSFPVTGDTTSAALWLTEVGHRGQTAAATELPTIFSGKQMHNRIWPVRDGLPPLNKMRITSVRNSLGAVISVNYADPDCTASNAAAILASPETNTHRCYPQWWTPDVTPVEAASLSLFHKYVVSSVISNPMTGGGRDQTMETHYKYTGSPRWRYDDSPTTASNRRTWSVYAGYDSVETLEGASSQPAEQQRTEYTFFQGMDGDRSNNSGGTRTATVLGATDALWFAGRTRRVRTFDSANANADVTSTVTTTPWATAVTAESGGNTARMIRDETISTKEPVSASSDDRIVEIRNTYSSVTGALESTQRTSPDAGITCTKLTHTASNETLWIAGLVSKEITYGSKCDVAGSDSPAEKVIGASRNYYDDQALGSAPSKGNLTSTEIVDRYTGATAASAHWVASGAFTYDAKGRPLATTDAKGRTVTTAYVPAANAAATSGSLTQITVSRPSPTTGQPAWVTKSVIDPAWGLTTSETDQNNRVTTTEYDGLGRTVSAWLPERPKANFPSSPSLAYSYATSATAASVVKTQTVGPTNLIDSYVLMDGLGRAVQTQTAAVGGGTVVIDTAYDSQGRVWSTNNAYWTSSVSPSGTLFVPSSQTQIPSVTSTVFDGAGREKANIVTSLGVEQWRTSHLYFGSDRTTTVPPAGGNPITHITDSLGQQTQLIQHLSPSTSITSGVEKTTYGYNASGAMTRMTDPANNVWEWEYDTLGRNIRFSDPDTGVTERTFDIAGNELTSEDARGVITRNVLDSNDRIIQKFATRPGEGERLILSWQYDTLPAALGYVSSASSFYKIGTTGTAEYKTAVRGYDAAYRSTGSIVTIPAGAPDFGGTSYQTSVSYTPAGSVNNITMPAMGGLDAEVVHSEYDSLGKLVELTGAEAYAEVSYTPVGLPAEYERNGATSVTSTFGYNVATGSLDGIDQSVKTGNGAAVVPQSTRYTRNAVGDITSIQTFADSPTVDVDTQCFRLDALRNLSDAWTPDDDNCTASPTTAVLGGPAPYQHRYEVDLATGNRTSTVARGASGAVTTANYLYGDRPHAVESVVSQTGGTSATRVFDYDAAGNTATKDGQEFRYNELGAMETVYEAGSNDDDAQTMIYDASGSLLIRSDPEDGTTLYLGMTELKKAATNAAASAVRTYSVNGSPVAERSTEGGGTTLTWICSDSQATGYFKVDEATGAQTRRYFDPFGNSRGTPVAWTSDHGFLNAPESGFTNLTHLGAREYDPTLGRFISVDAVLEPSSPKQNNGYSYAQNSPVTLSDPSGNRPDDAPSNWKPEHGYNAPKESTPGNTNKGKISSGCSKCSPIQNLVTSDVANVVAGALTSEIGMNESAIFIGIGDAITLCTLCLIWGEGSGTALIRKALGAKAEGDAYMSNGFYTFGSLWGGAAAGPAAGLGATTTLSQAARGALSQVKNAGSQAKSLISATKGATKAGGRTKTAKNCSFAGATPVLMADGSHKAIDQIVAGDRVIASDPATGEKAAKEVKKVFVHEDATLRLSVDGDEISTTEDHPFWSVTDSRFERADQLSSGELVLAADGESVQVNEMDPSSSTVELAYNLAVDGIHTYHVGSMEILVHNTCDEPWLDEIGETKVTRDHMGGTAKRKSQFNEGTDLYKLVDDVADQNVPSGINDRGRCVRVCDMGRIIGTNQSGIPTQYLTVVSRPSGQVITMHPGVPKSFRTPQ